MHFKVQALIQIDGLIILQEKVKWFRKAFGGGIRQCGSLAVAAGWCLDNHLPKLSATHDLARYLAVNFAEMGAELLLPVGELHLFPLFSACSRR